MKEKLEHSTHRPAEAIILKKRFGLLLIPLDTFRASRPSNESKCGISSESCITSNNPADAGAPSFDLCSYCVSLWGSDEKSTVLTMPVILSVASYMTPTVLHASVK